MFDSHRVFSLVYTVLQNMYIDMYRQFRLSTHRKDEFRRRAKRRGCMVTTKAVALENSLRQMTQSLSCWSAYREITSLSWEFHWIYAFVMLSMYTPLNSSGDAFQVCHPFQKVCIYMYVYTSYVHVYTCTVLCEKLHVYTCMYTRIVPRCRFDLATCIV